MKRYASEYVNRYNMRKVSNDTEHYYQKVIDGENRTIYYSVHRLDTNNECYFVQQVFYKNKFNEKTQKMGKMGNAQFTFGLVDDLFRTRTDNYDGLERL